MPSDTYAEQLQISLQSANDCKKARYHQPLQQAFQTCTDNGWQVAILSWVAGVRGLVIENHLKEVVGFLEISPTAWPTAWKYIIETSVRTSVEGSAFLNQVSFSTPKARKTWGILDRHGTGKQGENAAGKINGKRRREESGGENLLELMR